MSRYRVFLSLAWLVLGATAAYSAAVADADRFVLDFERVQGKTILGEDGGILARFEGEASVSDQAHQGGAAIEFHGPKAKGCVRFDARFAREKQGTLDFWCRPEKLSGIVVGKYGAINISFKPDGRAYFGLKLKDGWVACESPPKSVAAGPWVHLQASWGKNGMLLALNGKPVAKNRLPSQWEWFNEDKPFLLGSYDWPGSYDEWFFSGGIDDFTHAPNQELACDAEKLEIVHELKLKKTPKPNYDQAAPETVGGRVVLEDADQGVPGVSVTDGYSVAKTDAEGRYALKPSPLAVFLYITRPTEHDVVGSWYKPVAAEVDFTLKPAEKPEDDYTFIHVSDTHISKDARGLKALSRFVDEINALDPPPRFVINSGDLVNLDKRLKAPVPLGHEYFRNYTGMMNHLTMPHYHVAGDHTDSRYLLERFPVGDPRAGKALYWEYLGPNFYSFEYGKIHFVPVDFVYHLKEAPSQTLIPEHLEWLRRDMAARSPGTFVVTASENTLEPSNPGFRELARENDVRLQLVGDDHIVAYDDRSVPFRVGGALSGTWWNGPCADLSPQGYLIYHVRGEKMECFYKGLGQRVAIDAPRYGVALRGEVAFRAHLVNPKPGERLECSINGSPWKPMTEARRPLYRAIHETTGNSAAVPDGLVTLRVRSVPGGETRERVFVVHNTDAAASHVEEAALSFAVGQVWPSRQPPQGQVDVLLNDKLVGALEAKARKAYSFPVDPSGLRRINVLTFRFADAEDGMSISHPLLTVDGRTIEDPHGAAVREVREGHWPKDLVRTMGFTVGNGPNQHSFALKQDTFYFVLDPAE